MPDRPIAPIVKIQVGPISARFSLIVEVTEETPPWRVISVTRGEEGTRASIVSAENVLELALARSGDHRGPLCLRGLGRRPARQVRPRRHEEEGRRASASEFVGDFRAKVEQESSR